MAEKKVGKVFTYYSHIGVAALKLEGTLKIGDKIHIKGHTTDFEQTVDSIQIDRKDIKEAKKGQDVGIKVNDKVRKDDSIFVVS